MWVPIGFLGKENSSMAKNSPDASGLVQPLKLTDEEIEDQTESGLIQGHTAAQWLTEDWPAFSDFQTRDACQFGVRFLSPPLPVPGEGEIPGHSEQVHGDPRHRVLREPAAPRGPGLREEPRPLATARVPAAAAQGQSEPRPAPSFPGLVTGTEEVAPATIASGPLHVWTCPSMLCCPEVHVQASWGAGQSWDRDGGVHQAGEAPQ